MRAKTVTLILASLGLLLGTVLSAAAQSGAGKAGSGAVSEQHSDNWRARALRAKAEAPEAPPPGGRLRSSDERADPAEREGRAAARGDLGADKGDGKFE